MKIFIISAIVFIGLALSACPEKSTGPNIIQTPLENPAVVEKSVLNLINAYRKENARDTLLWSDFVASIARKHTVEMIALDSLDFFGSAMRYDTINKIIPYSNIMEIVSTSKGNGGDRASSAFYLWRDCNSSILLGNYKTAGIGVTISPDSTYYFMIILVQPL